MASLATNAEEGRRENLLSASAWATFNEERSLACRGSAGSRHRGHQRVKGDKEDDGVKPGHPGGDAARPALAFKLSFKFHSIIM